jgi:hypothetical protein
LCMCMCCAFSNICTIFYDTEDVSICAEIFSVP